MQNIDKNLKIKILALFILSNLSTCLMSLPQESTNEIKTELQESKLRERKNYLKIKITAHSLTSNEYGIPITILDKNNSIIIPHAFYIKRIGEMTNDEAIELLSPHKEHLIYTHAKYLREIGTKKDFKIVPFHKDILITKKKYRRSYELRY